MMDPAQHNQRGHLLAFPLLSLPVEIICKVLAACAVSEPPDAGYLGWIRLGHVGSTLRQILLTMTALWATAAFQLLKGVNERLERAQASPLAIDLHNWSLPYYGISSNSMHERHRLSASFLQTVIENLHRAHAITLPPDILEKSLPILESNDFVCLRNAKLVSTSDRKPTLQVSLPRAPVLRNLTMHNCVVSCDYTILESLNMRFQLYADSSDEEEDETDERFDTGILLKAVGLAANLRRLTISGSLFTEVTTTARLILPRLEDLHLDAIFDFCVDFWSVLIISKHTRVAVYIPGMDYDGWVYAVNIDETVMRRRIGFAGAIAHHFDPPGAPRINGIHLECSPTLRILLFSPETGAVLRKVKGPMHRDHVVLLDIRMDDMDGLLNLASAAPLACLNQIGEQITFSQPITLELFKSGRYSTAHWHEGLRHLDTVHTLVLDEFPPSKALWDAICLGDSPTSEGHLLPRLHVVYITLRRKSLPNGRDGEFSASDDLAEPVPRRRDSSDSDSVPVMESDSGSEDLEQFLQGDERLYERFGYQRGEPGEEQEPRVYKTTGFGVDPNIRTGGDHLLPPEGPWQNFVDGLECRTMRNVGIRQVVFHPSFWMSISKEARLRLKEDISAVAAEIVWLPPDTET
ncbi:unnamed protein product [Peniophora sp. CBMAI 1063]|nr:unnamed protein product [Peniophora sp. CBMAI 1063]